MCISLAYLHGKKKTLCTLTNEKNIFLCIAAKKNNQLFSVWSKLISLSTVITKKNFQDNKTVNKNILTDKILKDRICSFFLFLGHSDKRYKNQYK